MKKRDPNLEACVRINNYICFLERTMKLKVHNSLGIPYEEFKVLKLYPTPEFFYDIYNLYHFHKIGEDDKLYQELCNVCTHE